LNRILQIRAEIIKVLIDFYQKIPTAKYYEVASFDYKHGKNSIKKNSKFFVFVLNSFTTC